MTTDTGSELFRRQCEARYCLRKGREWFDSFIKAVRSARGKDAAQRLWDDVREQAGKGNVGDHGDWRA